jgi:hypothetical protein
MALAARRRPIFALQTGDSFELADVGGHKRSASASCLAGDKKIVRANRDSSGFELGANSSGRTGILIIKQRPF